jgi:hypothetical protein
VIDSTNIVYFRQAFGFLMKKPPESQKQAADAETTDGDRLNRTRRYIVSLGNYIKPADHCQDE